MFRTNVTIIGLGERITGSNAKGSYDFAKCAFSYDDRQMAGQAAATLIISGQQASKLNIGQNYEALLDFKKEDLGNGKYKNVLSGIYFL